MKDIIIIILRTAVGVCAAGLFLIFLINILSSITNVGSIAGAIACIWILCMIIAPVHEWLVQIFSHTVATRFIYRFVCVCMAVFLAYGAAVTAAMAVCASVKPKENATVIVLGAQVKNGGPSTMLRGRILAAETYLKQHPDAKAVLSGGKGEDEAISEALCMYNELVKSGIDGDRLYLEDKSTNTTDNFKFSQEVIKKNGLNKDLVVVTDGFHQLRARIIIHQLGIKESVGTCNADTSFLYLPTFVVREWFALPFQVLFR